MEENVTIQNNVRIYPEDKDGFAAYCKDNGLKQADAFRKAMKALQMDTVKESTPGRATDIEEVRAALELIEAKYLDSVRYANATEERTNEKYADKLASKDETIADLQAKNKELKEKLNAATTYVEEASKTLEEAQSDQAKAVAELEEVKKVSAAQFADKETIISGLQSEVARLAKILAETENYAVLVSELEKVKKEKGELETELKLAQKDVELARKEAEIRIKEEVQKIKDQMEAKMDKLRSKYEALLVEKATKKA